MAKPRAPVPRPLLLGGLGAAQILGWGSTFYLPSVLGPPIGEALGLSQDIVFAGVTVMYLTAALAAPRIGRVVDARGARATMAAGSVVAAAALTLLAAAGGLATYLAAWVVIGLMAPMTLGPPCFAAIAQAVPGPAVRRAMTLMTIATGFTSTLIWPATAAAEAAIGWRGTCLAFAAIHLAVTLPIYLTVLPRHTPSGPGEARPAQAPASVPMPQFVLLALSLGGANAVSSGLVLVVIPLLVAFGHAPAAAIALAALYGPAQVASRAIDLVLGPRSSAMSAGLFAAAMLPLSMLPLIAGGHAAGAAAFVLMLGTASGLMTVVRAALPLELVGTPGYGTLTGRLGLPGNIMIAASPPLFAAMLHRAGPGVAAALAGGLSLIALAALVALALARRAEGRS